MLFTDGGEERAQAILEKYNADKKVHFLTHTHTHSRSFALVYRMLVCSHCSFCETQLFKAPFGF